VATGQLTSAAAGAGGTPLWLSLGVAVIGSSVLAAVVGGVLTRLRETAAARRDRYAEAVTLLAARAEYPYRIRRRTSDDAAVLKELAEHGHDLQEKLAKARAWATSESPTLGAVYATTLERIDAEVSVCCRDAWTAPPVTSAAGMNLNGFGPRAHQKHIDHFQRCTKYRFGARRLMPHWWLVRCTRS
jgi:hypothetical protein